MDTQSLKMSPNLKRPFIIAALLPFFFSGGAFATLGEDVSSIDQDSANPSMQRKSLQPSASYTVQEMKTDSHTVKEYVNKSGVVFAVTWRGATPPDLEQLFGKYYQEYRAQLLSQVPNRPHAKRRSVSVASTHLKVANSIRMRDAHGSAILLEAVPSDVTIGEIQ